MPVLAAQYQVIIAQIKRTQDPNAVDSVQSSVFQLRDVPGASWSGSGVIIPRGFHVPGPPTNRFGNLDSFQVLAPFRRILRAQLLPSAARAQRAPHRNLSPLLLSSVQFPVSIPSSWDLL